MAELPETLNLHQVLPNEDGTRAVCLWEAKTLTEVQNFVEGSVGSVSSNSYFTVEVNNAVGLPNAVKAAGTV